MNILRNEYKTHKIFKIKHNDTQICVVFNTKFNKMEENKNLEQNLDKSNEKLHISDVSDSISFETKDYEKVRVKVGETNISIKTTKSNGTFNTIYIEEGQQLFDYLKKYYH